jgi:hypothetical protein
MRANVGGQKRRAFFGIKVDHAHAE